MAAHPRSRPIVVLSYGEPAPASATTKTKSWTPEHRFQRSPSADSGVAFADAVAPRKVAVVPAMAIVTVSRRRFARRDVATREDNNATHKAASRLHNDAPLGAELGRPQTREGRMDSASGEHQTLDQRVLRLRGDATLAEKQTLAEADDQATVALQPPTTPRPPRLPTPDIPDVEESTWWGK